MRNRWGPEGPPPDSYSRVTDAGRFAPLHDFAARLAGRLADEFEVERADGYGIDPELESDPARPTVRLRPADASAATITISFTNFPGLRVRFGRWVVDGYPRCGCDACDESAEEEMERLEASVCAVVEGRFQESISIPESGPAHLAHQFAPWSAGAMSLDADRARRLAESGGGLSYEYCAWAKSARRASE